MRIFSFIFVIICTCWSTSACAEKLEWAVTLVDAETHSSASSDSPVTHHLSIGHVLFLVQKDPSGRWVKDRYTGWVEIDSVAFLRQLKKIHLWDGPKNIYIENGDFAGNYLFRRNGSFTLEGEYSGHLFRKGAVIFAKKRDEADFGDVFVLDPINGLCWTHDMTQCAK